MKLTPEKEARKMRLEAYLSKEIGHAVEITIRGRHSFTFSTREIVGDLSIRLGELFAHRMTFESAEHDEECGSFVYMRANA